MDSLLATLKLKSRQQLAVLSSSALQLELNNPDQQHNLLVLDKLLHTASLAAHPPSLEQHPAPKYHFSKFDYLNSYFGLLPFCPLVLEILAPPLAFKSQLLTDLAATALQDGQTAWFISTGEQFQGQFPHFYQIAHKWQLYYLLSLALETHPLDLIAIDGISAMMYHSGNLAHYQEEIESLKKLFVKLKQQGKRIVVTSTCKHKDEHDLRPAQSILIHPWPTMIDATLTVMRMNEQYLKFQLVSNECAIRLDPLIKSHQLPQ